MQLQENHIKQFVTAISSLNWNTNYYKFCEILNFNPNHSYSEEKWQQFQDLTEALNYFDLESLMKLIEAYQTNQTNK